MMKAILRAAAARFRPSRVFRIPQAPSISAQVLSDTSILVTCIFEDPGPDEAEIERSTSSGSGFALVDTATVIDGTATFTDTGRTAATQYFYRARAKINSGALTPYSGYSSEDSATTSGASTPAQPTSLIVTEIARDADTITYSMSWTAGAGATSHDWWVEASTDGGYSNGAIDDPTNTELTSVPSIVVTRQPGHDETVFVVAGRNASGQGSNKRKPVTVIGNLRAPVLNIVSVAGSDNVEVRYTEDPDADAAVEYLLEGNVDGGEFSVVATISPGAGQPQYVAIDQEAGVYAFRVRGHNGSAVYSAYSAEKAAVVGAPPPTGWIKGADFSALATLADLAGTGFSVQHPNNISLDVGIGLKYTYVAKPLTCANANTLVTKLTAPTGLHRIWIDFTAIFSENWDTRNANCLSGNPDFKFFEAWPTNISGSGSKRCQIKMGVGGSKIQCNHLNWASPNNAPNSVIQRTTPINADALADGLPHQYRAHWHLFNEGGTNKGISQLMIDGVLMHSYKDISNPDWVGQFFRDLFLGQNRNFGPTEEMYIWWQNFYLYDEDPGWFDGLEIADWADNGGAPYVP